MSVWRCRTLTLQQAAGFVATPDKRNVTKGPKARAGVVHCIQKYLVIMAKSRCVRISQLVQHHLESKFVCGARGAT